jgi:Calcium binding
VRAHRAPDFARGLPAALGLSQAPMARAREQLDREDRIINEVVVDAYNEVERAMGWYYYLDDKLKFPFVAKCSKKRDTSPLKVGESTQVVRMAKEDDCMSEIFVIARHGKSRLAVPLGQLECLSSDETTCQAVADWHYWLARGYEY